LADCVDMACFTATNAREMAARSHEARRERQSAQENAPEGPDLSYPERRLARVRKQIDLLDKHLDKLLREEKVDEQAVERAARASSALSELEQKLDGRPNPGSLRPKPPKPKSWRDFPGPE
jgi:hypothetical protein